MASAKESGPRKKLPVAQLAAVGVVLVIASLIVLQMVGWQRSATLAREGLQTVLTTVTNAGPLVFFSAMAILPALGAPIMSFALTAGPVFGAQLGLATVTALGLAAITVNLTFSYWLARKWLRPWLARTLVRFGYQLPQVDGGDMTDLIVLLRVTPGIPFFIQNYLLGLADVPFLRYLLISCAVQWSYNSAFILFGDALSHGRGKTALLAIMLFAALVVGTHLVRKHYGKKRKVAA